MKRQMFIAIYFAISGFSVAAQNKSIGNPGKKFTTDFQSKMMVVAQNGCCKQWDNNFRVWRVISYDLGQCEEWNGHTDGGVDDVFEKKGSIWWDQSC